MMKKWLAIFSSYLDNYIVVYNEYSEIKQGNLLLRKYYMKKNINTEKYMFSFDELRSQMKYSLKDMMKI